MTTVETTLWRIFPWNPHAKRGAPFSPEYHPEHAGTGRFDLPLERERGVIYFAQTADHAVGEKLQDLRGQAVEDDDLVEHGHRLALVEATIAAEPSTRVIDLCDPEVLSSRGIRPDRLASRRRTLTQAIAAQLHSDHELVGFRWWSAFDGDWHTVILFTPRLREGALTLGSPTHLTTDHLSVIQATDALGIRRRGPSLRR